MSEYRNATATRRVEVQEIALLDSATKPEHVGFHEHQIIREVEIWRRWYGDATALSVLRHAGSAARARELELRDLDDDRYLSHPAASL